MTTATIDIDSLNKLFDNQKRLDDIFDSVFDEDPFLSSATPFSDYAKKQEKSYNQTASEYSQNNDILYGTGKTALAQRMLNMAYFVLPAIELAGIYYGISYFM